MRIWVMVVSMAAVVLTVVGGLAMAAAPAPGPTATGDGTALKGDESDDPDAKYADFNFDTRVRQVDLVSVTYVESGVLNQEFSGVVKCLKVRGSVAYISGDVKKLNPDGTNPNLGKQFLIKAVDNGQTGDRFDWYRRNVAYNCNNQSLERDYPVIEGGISVTG